MVESTADQSASQKVKTSYDQKYKELMCIGRGNFGSAWVVHH